MTKFGWIVTLLILVVIGVIVGGIIFLTHNSKPIPLPLHAGEVMPEPEVQTTNSTPPPSASSTASTTQGSSSLLQ